MPACNLASCQVLVLTFPGFPLPLPPSPSHHALFIIPPLLENKGQWEPAFLPCCMVCPVGHVPCIALCLVELPCIPSPDLCPRHLPKIYTRDTTLGNLLPFLPYHLLLLIIWHFPSLHHAFLTCTTTTMVLPSFFLFFFFFPLLPPGPWPHPTCRPLWLGLGFPAPICATALYIHETHISQTFYLGHLAPFPCAPMPSPTHLSPPHPHIFPGTCPHPPPSHAPMPVFPCGPCPPQPCAPTPALPPQL